MSNQYKKLNSVSALTLGVVIVNVPELKLIVTQEGGMDDPLLLRLNEIAVDPLNKQLRLE